MRLWVGRFARDPSELMLFIGEKANVLHHRRDGGLWRASRATPHFTCDRCGATFGFEITDGLDLPAATLFQIIQWAPGTQPGTPRDEFGPTWTENVR